MKFIKTFSAVVILTILPALSNAVFADAPKGHEHHNAGASNAASVAKATPTADADMTNAEVRKVDKVAKKITLKHEAIKRLDMPGMTMVFQVRNAALLDRAQVGDKVKVKIIQEDNAYVVTEIQPNQ